MDIIENMSSKVIKLKSLHFIMTILMFFIVNHIISDRNFKQMPMPSAETNLIKLEDIEFDNDKLSFVFFHDPDSELCEKMRFNVERLTEKDYKTINFYSFNIREHPTPFYQHNVSGVPNILIFKENMEIKRVMGLVPYKNLTRIIQKIEYKYGTE